MNVKSLFILSTTITCSVFAIAGNNSKQNENSFLKEIQFVNGKSMTKQDTIPISTADLGDFPFFGLPKNIQYVSKPLQREFDEIYFPVNITGKLVKFGGRVFKSDLTNTENSEWSKAYVLKSYDEAIKAVGGVKLFEGKFTPKQVKFMKENAEYLGEEGSLDFYNNKIHSYIIRRRDGDDIYIQLDVKYGAVQILQKEAFQQTITILKAEQVEKELNEKGKVVLYINFDTDKTRLKPEGKAGILEVATVLKNNPTLKLTIQGYTDNVGSERHNQKLSENRAQAVVDELVTLNIEASRLTAKGFGWQNPIADNTTPEGRAKNRRVELIKN